MREIETDAFELTAAAVQEHPQLQCRAVTHRAAKIKCNKAPSRFCIVDQALGTITERIPRLFGKGACNKVCSRSINVRFQNAGLWCSRSKREKSTLQIATGFGLQTPHQPQLAPLWGRKDKNSTRREMAKHREQSV